MLKIITELKASFAFNLDKSFSEAADIVNDAEKN